MHLLVSITAGFLAVLGVAIVLGAIVFSVLLWLASYGIYIPPLHPPTSLFPNEEADE